jgi:aerobic-type carbon monoxide dehydrogenase small subunit (CoxS/CutS family)
MITLTVNGTRRTFDGDPAMPLLWYLRDELALTGTKYGCGEGSCGACTVLVDGRAAHACTLTLKKVHGREVMTIEGLAGDGRDGRLHPLQQAFIDHGALQCGYCTPGMLLRAYSFLRENPKPSRTAIVAHMDQNLCRCGAHQRIVEAIEAAAQQMGRTS